MFVVGSQLHNRAAEASSELTLCVCVFSLLFVVVVVVVVVCIFTTFTRHMKLTDRYLKVQERGEREG